MLPRAVTSQSVEVALIMKLGSRIVLINLGHLAHWSASPSSPITPSSSEDLASIWNPSLNVDVDARSAAAPLNQTCWSSLHCLGSLKQWSADTQTCGQNYGQSGYSNASLCCLSSEPWSTCFLRMAKGSAGSSCFEIDSYKYEAAGLSDTLAQGQIAQATQHYLVYNIYGMATSRQP